MNARPNCQACKLDGEIRAVKADQSLAPAKRSELINELRATLSKTTHEHPTRSRLRSA